MRYERVKVKRDTNTVHNRAVPPWEIPMIEFIFDDGNVERLGEFEEVAGDYPDPANELDRLVRVYGSDPKSGVAHANAVFGTGRKGATEIRKLIDEAKAEDKAAKAPTPARKRGRQQNADSLLG
jgi:hypothetical protein